MVINTLATAVKVNATMNAVNMMAQHTPENQKKVLRQGIRLKTDAPCQRGKMTSRDTTVKKLRQKVISKLLALSNWRVTTPAIDHRAVTATMTMTDSL